MCLCKHAAWVATQADEAQTPYKTEKAIDTHTRFLESFLAPLVDTIVPSLWKTTSVLGSSKKMHSELQKKISALNNSNAAQACEEVTQILQNKLDVLVSSPSDSLQENKLHNLNVTLDTFAVLDKNLLADFKQQLIIGAALFEKNTTKIDEHVLALRKAFLDMITTVEKFWQEMYAHCQEAGWLAQETVPIKKRSGERGSR